MTRVRGHRGLRPAALILAGLLAAVAWPAHPAHAAVEKVTVTVSQDGLDPAVLNVTEGALVELTFVLGEKDVADDNRHVMFLEGLNLETEEIGADRRQTTVRFTAERVGRILFKCTLYCTGHQRMQAGYINVRPAGAGGVEIVAQATTMKLAVGHPEAPGARAILRAQLLAADGQPVEGVTVRFEQHATLITPGWIALGTARTDARGMAVLEYRPFGTSLQAPVRAVFEGTVRYQPTNEAAVVNAVELASPWHAEASLRVPGLGYWLLWTVLATIWGTFGYVVYNLFRLPEPETTEEGATT